MADKDLAAAPSDAVAEGRDTKAKKGSKLLLLVLPLALLPALGGGYLAYAQYPRLVAAATALGFGTDSAEPTADAPIEYGQFMELEGLIINPAGSDGKRYLMVNIGLEGPDEAVLAEVQEREVVVRDTILKVLGRRSVGELADVTLRSQIKDELVGAVNAVTREGEIQRLYFTQFVLQ